MQQEKHKKHGRELHDLPLRVSILRFRFKAPQGLALPPFNASAWRGALGHALRRTACVTGQKSCDACLLRAHCAYSYLFESPPPPTADRMRRYNAVPHPLVVRNMDRSHRRASGDVAELEVLLFGKAHEYLAFLIHAFERAGRNGLGPRQTPVELREVTRWQNEEGWVSLWSNGSALQSPSSARLPTLPPVPDTPIHIELMTPLRLVSKGRTLDCRDLSPLHLWQSLTRRLSMLCYFHEGVDLDAAYSDLHRCAQGLGWIQSRFTNRTWVRYSNRQRRRIPLQGIVGRASIDLTATPELWPWLWWGQWLHAGKATVMGLGQYRLTQESLPARQSHAGAGIMHASGPSRDAAFSPPAKDSGMSGHPLHSEPSPETIEFADGKLADTDNSNQNQGN